MNNEEQKACFLGFPEVKDQLRSSQADHDLLIELRKDIQNMQNEVRHYMSTKADENSLKLLQEGMVEWKKDIQDFTTSLYRSTQDQVNNQGLELKKIKESELKEVKDTLQSLIITRAKQAGIYLAFTTGGGLIAVIVPWIFNLIKL